MTAHALVVGEALVDVLRSPDGTSQEHAGGSPANVAVALGRLERPVALLTWLGHDPHGRLVRQHLEASGVRIEPGSTRAPATPVATAHLADDGVATYEFDLAWDLPAEGTAAAMAGLTGAVDDRLRTTEPPVVVHTGSIAAVTQPGAARVAQIMSAARASSTVTYDPNVRPAVMGEQADVAPLVDDLVARADVVKASDDDLAWLAPDVDPREVAVRWSRSGPALVVVTRGAAGALAVTSRGVQVDVEAVPVEVADTVGAGDAFMAALIDGLWRADLLGAARRAELHAIDGGTLRGILEHAGRVAAITVSRPGANPPSRADLEAA